MALLPGVLCVSGGAQSFSAPDKSPASLPASSSGGNADAAAGAYNSDFTTPGLGAGARPAPGTTQVIQVPVPNTDEELAQLPAAIIGSVVDSTNPQGEIISATSRSLTRGGNAWTPVMGEFHYSRCPAEEWRGELLKMKAGGIDIVATYVFWIHHEEVEGSFVWSGERDLRKFVQTCAEVGLDVIVRSGPWCHGEVRNGGLPDWLVASECRLRSDDPAYLKKVRVLYREIGAQLHGLLWKDGGVVIGVQIENEYRGPAEHLLTLKNMAVECGLNVPLYTRTGWPALTTPMPRGEMTPLYGVYAEGFWDRELTPMPGSYWAGFRFSTLRVDANIANEALGRADVADDPDVASYPYLTCEIGGGMMSAYHRRILVDPRDIESTTLVKLGSGSVQLGYYMYHGGVNPDAITPGITLEENQSTRFTNWNDLPKKNYDFQAPLGAAGQVRPQFHLQRRQHLFMHDFGYLLPGMPAVLPANRPKGKDDNATLRWALRSNGRSGFIFVNNYQRLQPMPVHRGVQFALNLPPVESVSPIPGGIATSRSENPAGAAPDAARRAVVARAVSKRMVPVAPVDIPSDVSFMWPFNLDLGSGAILAYATAQPLCYVDTPDEKTRTYFFSEIPGIPPELAFDDTTVRLLGNTSGRHRAGDGLERITSVKTGRARAITLRSRDPGAMTIQIVVLTHADSLNLYKFAWGGDERVILSPHVVTIDTDESLRVHAPVSGPVDVYVYPLPPVESGKKQSLFARLVSPITNAIKETGSIFTKITVPGIGDLAAAEIASPRAGKIRDAGPVREIPAGRAPKPVAASPLDADFAAAAVWEITLPAGVWKHATEPLLRIHYTGDVARVLLDGKVILDDFYNGQPLDVPLARFARELDAGARLAVEILPLRKDAPIMLPNSAHPRFGARASIVELGKVEIVQTFLHILTPAASDGTNKAETDE
ncbi:MAG: beta-galactosidase [Opitutaceae bacterium]|jgi:hypothetical protein|nr:beta-galactosidase [Opitutaceae bacterium]